MEYVVVAVAAMVASGLTLFSGFGLGTLLLPAFAVFFPAELAVAATAVVHGANNVFKTSLLGRHADRGLVLRFGLPAVVAALAGASILGLLSGLEPVYSYTLGSRPAEITPLKLVLAVLMTGFAAFELLPRFRKLEIDRKYLTLGGLLSGFFGGLSGHQGALRSAFLAKVGVSTQGFVGTNAVIGLLVDLVRLAVYGTIFFVVEDGGFESRQWLLIAVGVVAAFAGVLIGKRYLHKVTMRSIQIVTGVLLLVIAVALGSGIL
jgi:hypothetical protein